MMKETATLAGGCFWCLEAVYRELKGVERVQSGYANGRRPNPTYEQVCTGTTGHAEVVQIEFDPSVITFGDLLDVFFTIHDPTTLDRQGNDVGTQYRSGIFTHDDGQDATARAKIAELTKEGTWDDPIVTVVEPLKSFYSAEAYHDAYYEKTGDKNPYCTFVVAPKVAKARQKFAARLKRA